MEIEKDADAPEDVFAAQECSSRRGRGRPWPCGGPRSTSGAAVVAQEGIGGQRTTCAAQPA